MTLIAEDLLLLCFNDEIGNQLQQSYLNEALGAALLAEVDLTGALRLVKPGRFKPARVQIAEGTPTPSDPLLGRALAAVAEADRNSWELVKLIGTKALKQELLEQLVDRGILRSDKKRVLGLVSINLWPAVDSSSKDSLYRELSAVLLNGQEPTPRMRVIVALLYALERAHSTINPDGTPARHVRRRAKQLSDGVWAAETVRLIRSTTV
ncbi:GPP34 family phosphoprotein [Saxibacter everestensis]|uniref:GPP34 family phosphoprotein n=1 Tax=Saxibacter everestensis TaxID=2909229 RepID=A0ABY8QUQ2_9MICO|nr:GPP34 family phosphoprotein [Brevibacteriaceae bacterium ZFBP1038]